MAEGDAGRASADQSADRADPPPALLDEEYLDRETPLGIAGVVLQIPDPRAAVVEQIDRQDRLPVAFRASADHQLRRPRQQRVRLPLEAGLRVDDRARGGDPGAGGREQQRDRDERLSQPHQLCALWTWLETTPAEYVCAVDAHSV